MIGPDWLHVTSNDDRLRALYARHYSYEKRPRQARGAGRHPNSDRVVGPGEYMAMITADGRAAWVWRLQQYRLDAQTGLECVLFRNEGALRSSSLVEQADALADVRWPGLRHFTFVNPKRIRSTNPGYCFQVAGWRRAGKSARGLVILERPSI